MHDTYLVWPLTQKQAEIIKYRILILFTITVTAFDKHLLSILLLCEAFFCMYITIVNRLVLASSKCLIFTLLFLFIYSLN